MINVTKPHLPDRQNFDSYVDRIYQTNWLTNDGILVRELESRLTEYLGVKNLVLVSSGGMAMHIAFKLFELTGEVITTPFSYVATTSTIIWDGLAAVHSDIDNSLNIDSTLIPAKINQNTSAILPVHTFGNPCDIEGIAEIASQHRLKVIYDAAHCFGTRYHDQSVLNYGDASILSFHATKLFHTIEGGALIFNDSELYSKAMQLRNYGFEDGEIRGLGINGRMNEFSAAMGLAVLDEIQGIKTNRDQIWNTYHECLRQLVAIPDWNSYATQNHHYMPILLKDAEQRAKIEKALIAKDIYPRRYFSPSLDELEYMNGQNSCPISRNVASRILCLPIYPALKSSQQKIIIETIIAALK